VHFTSRKSATNFLRVNTVSDKVVRHSLAYLPCNNGSRGTSLSKWKFSRNWPTPFKTPISLVAPQP